MGESDHQLIMACRTGDPGAWERLLDKYQRLVFSIPLNYGLSHEDAADIAQITFTILMQSLDQLQQTDRLGGWLATVARRHTWRLLEGRRYEVISDAKDLAEHAAQLGLGTADTIERWELIEWLHGGLAALDERCRTLLLALYFDPKSATYAAVAQRLGMPVGGIGPTRARCLWRLKQLLQRE